MLLLYQNIQNYAILGIYIAVYTLYYIQVYNKYIIH